MSTTRRDLTSRVTELLYSLGATDSTHSPEFSMVLQTRCGPLYLRPIDCGLKAVFQDAVAASQALDPYGACLRPSPISGRWDHCFTQHCPPGRALAVLRYRLTRLLPN